MIAKIRGEIIEKLPSYAVIMTAGVGFKILISSRTFESLPAVGDQAELDIYTYVREDNISLVGFSSLKEKKVFLKLLDVNGVSIKIALSIFSIYSVDEVKNIIAGRETDLLRRVTGIGKKLAERIILELSEKFSKETDALAESGIFKDRKLVEVRQALNSLGYSNREIDKVLGNMDLKDIQSSKIEDILKMALKEV
ncbi:MAG: Holliday junction branch migration protein RuvA [Actinomycetota bacterium]